MSAIAPKLPLLLLLSFLAAASACDEYVIGTDDHIEGPMPPDRTGGWPAPVRIDTDDRRGVRGAHLGMDRADKAVVIWSSVGEDDTHEIWAARHASGAGWAAPVQIGSARHGLRAGTALAVAPSGQAFALWASDHIPSVEVRANHLSGGVWQGEVLLATHARPTDAFPVVRVGACPGPSGAVAAWGFYGGVYASLFDGTRWTNPTTLKEPGSTIETDSSFWFPTQAAICSSTGERFVFFHIGDNVYVSGFRAGGWSAAVQLGPSATELVGGVDVGIDDTGAVHAFGTDHTDPASHRLWHRIYAPESGWSSVDVPDDDSCAPSCEILWRHGVVRANGDAVMVWIQGSTLLAANYSAGVWTAPHYVSSASIGAYPTIAVGPAGMEVVMWQSSGRLFAARYIPADGWHLPEQILSRPDLVNVGVMMDSKGRAVSAFRSLDGIDYHLWALHSR